MRKGQIKNHGYSLTVKLCRYSPQGTLGYLLEEEVEERKHPFPEPDTSLLKNKNDKVPVLAVLAPDEPPIARNQGGSR
ncbi:hypothetical protein NQZ68_028342 [Dissostichus eleginoides]|nr:hypothetical protein NQZ68_028342 [Dissostichus eleginoides]